MEDYGLEVTLNSSAQDFLKTLRSEILEEVLQAKRRVNRVLKRKPKIVRGTCLKCNKTRTLSKWAVCGKCLPGIRSQLAEDNVSEKAPDTKLLVTLAIKHMHAKSKKRREINRQAHRKPIDECYLSTDEELDMDNLGDSLYPRKIQR